MTCKLLAADESWACHMGQYDYEPGGPVYFPEQEQGSMVNPQPTPTLVALF